jgi:Tfp pilus assembly protein PilO
MGIALGIGKVTATLWLKQNWNIAPWSIRVYLLSAIAVLMLITSMGIFGFLSKAHSDQSLVSGDVQSKIAIYDEKIKTAKDNIDANRKALKQMDEAVDQVMARSSSETGADKAVGLRRSQQKERGRLQSEIQAEQKTITSLSEERAPIAAEVRKVEAEVGPIKYIAQFVYGETDETILEKAVTWVIIILIIVFDPLAVILLLSSQISFQNFRERETVQESVYFGPSEYIPDTEEDTLYAPNVGEKPTAEELKDDLFPTFEEITEGDSPEKEPDVVSTATVTTSILEQHPYLNNGFTHFEGLEPMVYTPEPVVEQPKEYVVEAALIDALEGTVNRLQQENDDLKNQLEDLRKADFEAKLSNAQKTEIQSLYSKIHQLETKLTGSSEYVQNEEQSKSGLWRAINSKISEEEYIDKIRKQNDNTDNAA